MIWVINRQRLDSATHGLQIELSEKAPGDIE
jgi:hypothetical protein